MIFFVIILLLACGLLGLIILVQNPKGGGLAGNVAGFSNQFMGVKQTTDVLEKGTWIFAAIIGVLCLTASLFIRGGTGSGRQIQNFGPPPNQLPSAPAGPGATQPTSPAGQPPAATPPK